MNGTLRFQKRPKDHNTTWKKISCSKNWIEQELSYWFRDHRRIYHLSLVDQIILSWLLKSYVMVLEIFCYENKAFTPWSCTRALDKKALDQRAELKLFDALWSSSKTLQMSLISTFNETPLNEAYLAREIVQISGANSLESISRHS